MRTFSGVRIAASALYAVVAALFIIFFVYIGLTENVSVYSARHAHDYHTVTGYTVEQVEDPSAPAGVRAVYSWMLRDVNNSESCLCFYIVHQHADVYIDGQLVQSLTAAETNRIGATVSSNWVTVPVHQEDDGKEIQIVLTPLFESVLEIEPEFLIGSHFTIVFDRLWQDVPALFVSVLCIFLGFIIIVAQLYFILRTHAQGYNMIYLGSFSIMLGLWRVTALKVAPILFSSNPMLLGYISIGCLFLCSVVLLLYASTLFSEKKATPLLALSIGGSVVSLVVLMIQWCGIADFKEMLSVSHVMLIITILSVPAVSIVYHKNDYGRHVSADWFYFMILSVGIIVDVVRHYIYHSMSNIMFTVIAFLIYALIVFVSDILDTTQKAYIDAPTGLVNRAHWDELMSDHSLEEELIGMVMMDLNGLKKVNDTYGHTEGDRMIRRFSKLLLDTFPSSSRICRWGGDEFAVMMVGAVAERLSEYIEALRRTVDTYNADSGELPVSYAVGYALSSEFPQLSKEELLGKADERMYQDKRNRR